MKGIILFSALVAGAWVHASPTLDQLATVSNDRNADVSMLSLEVENNGTVDGLYFSTKHADTGQTTHTEFPLSQIQSADGVVLDGDATHKVFILQGTIDAQKGSGLLTVKYLANGLTGEYQQCGGIKLQRAQDQKWSLFNYKNQPLTKIEVVTWALGISTVQNVCP
jgi:hypothetical protein